MTDMFSEKYWNGKWSEVISKLPNGGKYFFNHRQHGYNIIKSAVARNSSVFDYACGLAIIDAQLRKEKACRVNGCDLSSIAVEYAKKETGGDFRKGSEIFGGPYDYILAIYFLEHITNPASWCAKALKHGKRIIAALPNNFKRAGEHTKMAWTSWKSFYEIFSEFKIERIDEGKYPTTGLHDAFKHPILEIRN